MIRYHHFRDLTKGYCVSKKGFSVRRTKPEMSTAKGKIRMEKKFQEPWSKKEDGVV